MWVWEADSFSIRTSGGSALDICACPGREQGTGTSMLCRSDGDSDSREQIKLCREWRKEGRGNAKREGGMEKKEKRNGRHLIYAWIDLPSGDVEARNRLGLSSPCKAVGYCWCDWPSKAYASNLGRTPLTFFSYFIFLLLLLLVLLLSLALLLPFPHSSTIEFSFIFSSSLEIQLCRWLMHLPFHTSA